MKFYRVRLGVENIDSRFKLIALYSLMESALPPVPVKSQAAVRFVTFNVNGTKTLCNYHPWNKMKSFDKIFGYLFADIITLQELKVQKDNLDHELNEIPNYRSFVTLATNRKGYSGVGVFVRIPADEESDQIKSCLAVVHAEEGITGYLKSSQSTTSYRDLNNIGGYPDISEVLANEIDFQGRCVVLELGNMMVIISVYCFANSMGTEQGEFHRVLFLRCILERAEKLQQMGKTVVIMGDINVSRDLIDNEVYLREGIADKSLIPPINNDGAHFEEANKTAVLQFRTASQPRSLLNSFIKDKYNDSGILHDTFREHHGRVMRSYTVWNTLKNTRPLNIGSRIDLILCSTALLNKFKKCEILPWLMGSDHCPVIADFEPDESFDSFPFSKQPLSFEARYHYKTHNGCKIDSFFKSRSQGKITPTGVAKPPKSASYQYRSRKKQNPGYFKSSKNNFSDKEQQFFLDSYSDQEAKNKDGRSTDMESFKKILSVAAGPPLCDHNEPCVLRVCKKESKNKGRKFWCCSRAPRPDENSNKLDEYRCNTFQWQ